MVEKVQVSREVEGSRNLVIKKWTLSEVFNMCTADFDVCHEDIKTLKKWHYENSDEGEGLMNLLLGNYEVELTTEERIKEIFDSYAGVTKTFHAFEVRDGIEEILRLTGIKIEGVND